MEGVRFENVDCVKKGDKIVSGVYLTAVRPGIFLVSLYYLLRMILTA
jgi:hypothetical protein